MIILKKSVEEKLKANKCVLIILVMLAVIMLTNFFFEKEVFASFFKEDTATQTKFLTNTNLTPYLKKFDGGVVQLIFVQLGWLLIKGAYFLTSAV